MGPSRRRIQARRSPENPLLTCFLRVRWRRCASVAQRIASIHSEKVLAAQLFDLRKRSPLAIPEKLSGSGPEALQPRWSVDGSSTAIFLPPGIREAKLSALDAKGEHAAFTAPFWQF